MADVVTLNPHRAAREAVLKQHLDAHNAGDIEGVIASFKHPRIELVASNRVLDGADAVRTMLENRRRLFPDQHFEIITVYHADEAVICEYWMSATHAGSIEDIEPTHRHFKARMASIFLFDGPDLIANRIYADFGAIARQLA